MLVLSYSQNRFSGEHLDPDPPLCLLRRPRARLPRPVRLPAQGRGRAAAALPRRREGHPERGGPGAGQGVPPGVRVLRRGTRAEGEEGERGGYTAGLKGETGCKKSSGRRSNMYLSSQNVCTALWPSGEIIIMLCLLQMAQCILGK